MKSFTGALLLLCVGYCCSCNQAVKSPHLPKSTAGVQNKKVERAANAMTIFTSTDGGHTWQDLSKGLPETFREDSMQANGSFINQEGLFLRVGNHLYQHTYTASASVWIKKPFLSEDCHNNPARSGIFTYPYWGVYLKKKDGTNIWSPIFQHFQTPRIRCVFETKGGSIFIGTDKGIFKTANNGATWKQVYAGALVGNLAELNGILLATSMQKIIQSTDGGEQWSVVSSGGNVVFDVKQINGGFAAITAATTLGNRRLTTSYDGGNTWQPIDVGIQNKALADAIWKTWNHRPRMQAYMTSIVKVGNNYLCMHPNGIYSSSDHGKTWELVLPSPIGKVLNIAVFGKVIYAVSGKSGC